MTTSTTSPLTRRLGCSLAGLALLLPWCACVVPVTGQILGESLGVRPPHALWPVALSLGMLALLWPLGGRSRNPRWRAAVRLWRLAALFPLFTLPAALFDPAESQAALMVQLVMTLLYLALVVWIKGGADFQSASAGSKARATSMAETDGVSVPLALALGLALGLPWFAWGAVGSPLDVALGLVNGLILGGVAMRLMGRVWLPVVLAQARTWREGVADGLVVGLALMLLASTFGVNGASNVLMVALFPLGWLVVALAERRWPAWQPLSLVVGLAAAWPLVFSDTDTLSPLTLFEGRETLSWALQAAGVSGVIALALAGLAGVLARPGSPLASRWSTSVVALGLGMLCLTAYALQGHAGFYGDRVFVILKDQADLSAASRIPDPASRRQWVYQTLVAHAERTQADLRDALDRAGIAYTPYYLVNALEVQGGTPTRLLLSRHPAVSRVLPSPVLRPLPEPMPTNEGDAPAPTAPPWNIESIGASRVWQTFGAAGQGIVVGQSDSGVEWSHPQLRGTYRGGQGAAAAHDYNWYDPWDGDPEPTDTDGHGTHTLGIVLGQTVGVAPGATWMACKNLGRNVGNPARYLGGLQFMLAPFPRGGDPFHAGDPSRAANVLNNSWGCPQASEGCDPLSLEPAVRALRAAGIFVVASAGNEGPQCSTVSDPLAIYPEVFSVGAMDREGQVTSFSSVGPVTVDGSGRLKPDLVAPGAGILSSFPHGTYFIGDGTSQAGPHVVGVVALMWSANPRLVGDIERTEDILRRSAAPYRGGPNNGLPPAWSLACSAHVDLAMIPNPIVGYGVLDAYRAVELAR
ncbi:MAG: S8 family serine peptidase [Anaerolineae bacterium]|nr:S8 family serine peptidase [Anaerolineae bacterium]